MGLSAHTMKAKAKAARMKPTDLSLEDLHTFLNLLDGDIANRNEEIKYARGDQTLGLCLRRLKKFQQTRKRVGALINHHNKTKGV